MEFKFLDSDKRLPPPPPPHPLPSPSPLTDGYFTAQALSAGLFDGGRVGAGEIGRPDFLRSPAEMFGPPFSAGEVLRREIEKQRIREEIIAREIARKRILEEEVRRELAVERAMAAGRRVWDRFSLSGLGTDNVDDVRFSERLMSPMSDVRIDKRVGASSLIPRDIGGFRRLPQHSKVEIRPLSEDPPVKPAVVGIKRKASSTSIDCEAPLSIKKEWSCALCQVSVTSQEGLKDHLQGRKHKAKEALLNVNTIIAKHQAISTSTPKAPVSASTSEKLAKKDMVVDEPISSGTKPIQKEKQQKTEGTKKRTPYFFCRNCKVKCNSEKNMNAHISGKKHQAFLELNKSNENKQIVVSSTTTTEAADTNGIKGVSVVAAEEAKNKVNKNAKMKTRIQREM
ncbi:hypothetical protein QJS04_geneDACA003855 [Acorus gramineus]|uniref:C2H2-type domain-containing protein n=1 Tax=Acorus gramineus TaxID=55184 RepID=A0AAV9BJJ0_ACOGR|nr:hypothetical protein QJS04_geneDACA003855 [Acorus gramineus]